MKVSFFQDSEHPFVVNILVLNSLISDTWRFLFFFLIIPAMHFKLFNRLCPKCFSDSYSIPLNWQKQERTTCLSSSTGLNLLLTPTAGSVPSVPGPPMRPRAIFPLPHSHLPQTAAVSQAVPSHIPKYNSRWVWSLGR